MLKRILSVAFGAAFAALSFCGPALPQAGNVLIGVSPPAGLSATPALSGASNTVTFTLPPGSATLVAPNIVAICGCSSLSGATAVISSGLFTGDVLNSSPVTGITPSYSAGTLTFTGTASVAAYNQALDSVTYASSSSDPTNGGTAGTPGTGSNPTRTITWQVANGGNTSNSPTSTINVNLAPLQPTLSATGSTGSFVSAGTSGPVTLESGITIGGSATTLTSAQVAITSGLLGLDTLAAISTPGGITAAYTGGTGVLLLSGTTTVANYQTALRSVQYNSTSADPTNSGADTSRSISWTVFNGSAASATVPNTTVTIANPLQPTLTVSAGNNVSYTAGGANVTVDPILGLTCSCTTLTGASLAIGSYQTGDAIQAVGSTLSPTTNITASFNTTTGVMTLSGTDTVANYLAALRALQYFSTQADPTFTGQFPSRVATWGATNGTLTSGPQTTTINMIIPGQPSWALSGSAVALNPATNQAWISGIGTEALSTQLQVTRASTETCYDITIPPVDYAAPNTPCTVTNGMPIWGAYTNGITFSNDASNARWNQFKTGTAGLAVTGNSALSPDGVNTTAALVSISRTSTADTTEIINAQLNFAAGTYSTGVWLKLDSTDTNYATCLATPSTCNKVIQTSALSPGNFIVKNVLLTAAWVNYPSSMVATSACVGGGSPNCGYGIGYTNQAGSGPAVSACSVSVPCATALDVWGAEINAGATLFPTVPTGTNTVLTPNDAVQVVPGSALENALKGTAFSIIMNTTGSIQGIIGTLIDANGTTLLGKTAGNVLTTALGSSASTTNSGSWTSAQTVGFAKDSTGRSMALNGNIVYRDAQQILTTPTPISFGSTQGSANFFNGFIGITNVYATRVPDSQLGVTGAGTKYYFADPTAPTGGGPHGNDLNACTISAPCASITKANTLSLVTNDQVLFNGGDTFTGCLSYRKGTNYNATRTNGVTLTSYGAGQATLTPNCSPANAQGAILFAGSTDGLTVSNLHFQGDAAGGVGYGINIANCEGQVGQTHGNITIQNNTFTGIHASVANNQQYTADIVSVAPGFCNGDFWMTDHVAILNNTAIGASPTATDSPFMSQPGYQCAVEYDAIQGNLVANIGGQTGQALYLAGTGIGIDGVCPFGSTSGGQPGGMVPNPAGGPGAIAQFNVVHDNGTNTTTACGFYDIWTSAVDSIIIRANETYNSKGGAGCDHGAFDFDISSTNSLGERNYVHNETGPCLGIYSGGNTTAITYRWNICDGTGPASLVTQNGGALSWIYNNTLIGTLNSNNTAVNYDGCPAAGSLFANNIIVNRSNRGQQNMLSMGVLNSGSQCSPGPTAGLKFANNNWWSDHAPSFQLWATTCNGCSFSSPLGSSTTYAAMASVIGETGGMSITPSFQNTIGLNVTCNSTVGSSGPQATGCPSAYRLAGGSAMAAGAGAVLTAAPYNLPTTIGGTANKYNGMGLLTYYGDTVPCVGAPNGGIPIGADCGSVGAAPPAPTVTQTTSPQTTATPLIAGTGITGNTLHLSIDGTVVTSFVLASSSWSFQTTSALSSPASHSVTATQTNSSGTSPVSNTDTFTVDTRPPAPTITSPFSGQVVADTTPTITGNGTTGDTINVTVDGTVQLTQPTVSGGAWNFTTGTLAGGGASHTVTATQTSSGGTSATAASVTFTVNISVTLHLDFTTGSLPGNTNFTGGAGASYYTASAVLHPNNAANNPRFDHNPANGALLGLAVEPAYSNYWAASNPTSGNTNTNDNDHNQLFSSPPQGGSNTTTAWYGVWGIMAGSDNTGPDNVANSAGTFREDNCWYGTNPTTSAALTGNGTGVPCSSGNFGDGGHASANNIQPGGTTGFGGGTTLRVSAYVSATGPNARQLTFYDADGSGNDCYAYFNIPGGVFNSFLGGTTPTGGYTCSAPSIVLLQGTGWYRVAFTSTGGSTPARMNFSNVNSTGTAYEGDGSSGFHIYGAMISPTGTVCVPQVTTSIPCQSGNYIANTNTNASPVTTTADTLRITSVPAGINFLTVTFDDGTTQKFSCGCSGVSNYTVGPSGLNRPWIKFIDGSNS